MDVPTLTAATRRKIWIAVLIVWNTVGIYVTVVLRNQLWWVQAMSHAAISIALLTGYSAETPVEQEGGNK